MGESGNLVSIMHMMYPSLICGFILLIKQMQHYEMTVFHIGDIYNIIYGYDIKSNSHSLTVWSTRYIIPS